MADSRSGTTPHFPLVLSYNGELNRTVNSLSTLSNAAITATTVFVFNTVVGIPLVCFGLIANVLNLIVFSKQGYKDSINISLTYLSASDLSMLVVILWQGITLFPSMRNVRWPFSIAEMSVVTASMPRVYFTQVSSVITAYISLERCFSVLKPLQIKSIFTRKRLFISMSGIYLLNATPFIYDYYLIRIAQKFDPIANKTYWGVIYLTDDITFQTYGLYLLLFLTFSTFSIITVCAVLLVLTLYRQSRWRGHTSTTTSGNTIKGDQEDTATSKGEDGKKGGNKKRSIFKSRSRKAESSSMSSRDMRAANTMAFLASMFVVCYLPNVVIKAVMLILPQDFSRRGRYAQAYTLFHLIAMTSEGFCASANILVYLKTSTRYRETLKAMLCAGGSKELKS